METKDWIQVLVELLGNGVILAIFGTWLDFKMEKKEKKEEKRSEIIQSFLAELVKLNKSLIMVNHTVQFKKIKNSNEIMNLLEEHVLKQWVEIISIYDTYSYDLKEFEPFYNNMEQAWYNFTQQTTAEMLGKALQDFKEGNKELITKIRKKY